MRLWRKVCCRDLTLTQQNRDASEDAAMNNPLGGIARGWPEIRGVYERLFSGPARVRVEFFDYTLHVFGTVFFAVGREREQLQARNATSSSSRYARVGFSALLAGGGADCTTVRSIGPTYSRLIGHRWKSQRNQQ
jgi:hypothetical protein